MPARNARERSQIARIAALSRSATESGRERLAAANKAYRDSFNRGHECNVCKLVTIDQGLPADEVARRGAALYRRHMQALALKRDRNRRVAAELEAEADAADEELAGIASAE